jgi:hypothetical protein
MKIDATNVTMIIQNITLARERRNLNITKAPCRIAFSGNNASG